MASAGEGTALTYETLTWDAPVEAGYGLADLRAAQRQAGEYEAAIPASIAELAVSLPAAVLADAEEASNEITRFDAELGEEIAPFAAVLLRSESAASSNIENLTASARAIAEAEALGDTSRRNAALIVSNTEAMKAAVALADRLDDKAILAMHAALMHHSAPVSAGNWRTEQVWIGGGNFGPRGADYIAPHHTRVPGAIEDLLAFTRRADVPSLPQIAIAHAQFETIHPFTDGNGRTGRALIQAMLRHKRLTRQITVPVSAGLLTDTDAYFGALGSYRDGDPAPIVERLSEASLLAVANGRRLVTDLRSIREEWDTRIAARRDSAVHRVADLLIQHPVFNAQLLQRELGITTGNARRYVDPLTAAGIIAEFTDRARNRAWRAPEVLSALDAFAARAGRRSRSG
ncbi:Fic family protein [Mycolicibacterium smegmatis]|uniref:Fic protein family protein n=1 Tax=Mycolicibacterium smegmatis (strain MKD8) TaxID=1214915 RepID=A0A2U9PMW5_MYCSE|nr:Fic family protein [Mycolicibacterium smegmatis]AWT53100.1 Fic protein family protein [Mycolicibacterium smegmatis MKD8]MCP2622763.1 Fic family protein [Mycolicibacterium smegmatis]MDF1903406.1 Fic family protein [Mycolicibacterium smegmatis]MDF1909905.1 Fic family protein [Mycolicibacterium smegmatis]MDF1919127.1 Fic family protein [Mycolicibacterium smegmatis]